MDLVSGIVGVYRLAIGLFALIGFVGSVYLIFSGLGPALHKLARGLAKRKIAVFAKADQQATLGSMLASSGLFKKKRIEEITSVDGLGTAEKLDVFLVHWPDFQDNLDDIIGLKKDPTALIVYAPVTGGRIPDEVLNRLNAERNVTVCNMRGRLMSDIVVSMITSGYEQK